MSTLAHDEIARLSPQERRTPVGALCASLDPSEVPVTAAHRAELMRRLDSFEADRAGDINWGQVKARLARRAP
jgi:putative addiction module component (TIGR02574 family)